MTSPMTMLSLTATHAKVAGRQKALWFTAIPLTAFAALLAIISPARPGTGGSADLAFTGTIIAIFTGIAYSAAFADFFTAPARLGMQELEASTAVPTLALRAGRVLGAFAVVVTPSLLVLLLMGISQTIGGHPWAIPAALAVTVTIIAPAALVAMSLSGLIGALLPRAFGRIVAMLIWFYLVFSTPMLPLPTLNGTPLNVIGDTIAHGWFGAPPVYPPAGPLGLEATPITAGMSLAWLVILIALLLTAGSALADRAQKH